MTTDSKAVQGDWAEQIARAAMGRHAVDVVALDEVASQLRAAEHRGYTMGHKAGDDFRSAALASTAGAVAGDWEPIETAPKDGTPIVGCTPSWQQAERFEFVCAGSSPMGWRGPSGRVAEYMQPTLWKPWPVTPGQSPAVPASPRSGAGEISTPSQAQILELLALAHWLRADGSANDADNVEAAVAALTRSSGAGRSSASPRQSEV